MTTLITPELNKNSQQESQQTMGNSSSNVHCPMSVGSPVGPTPSVDSTTPRVTQNQSLNHSLTQSLKPEHLKKMVSIEKPTEQSNSIKDSK